MMICTELQISNRIKIALYPYSFSFEGSKETKILFETEDTSLYLSFGGDIHVAVTSIQML